MKLSSVKMVVIAVLSTAILIIGCKSKSMALKSTISVASLKKATLDTNRTLTLLQILTVYPAQIECSDNTRYANLYICKKFTNGDTVLVFEECKRVDKSALDTNSHYAGVVNKENSISTWPNEFTIFVPSDFQIPKSATSFFANLEYQTEY